MELSSDLMLPDRHTLRLVTSVDVNAWDGKDQRRQPRPARLGLRKLQGSGTIPLTRVSAIAS